MDESFHFSDVSSSVGRISGRHYARQQSISYVVRSYRPTLHRIEDRPLQLPDYTQQLSTTKRQIEKDKTDLRSGLTRATDDFRVDEFDAEQEMRRLCDEQPRIMNRQNDRSEALKSQQRAMAGLKAEAARIGKRIE
jgi:predicted  nucleic acid-binding Zn-ribbon protein